MKVFDAAHQGVDITNSKVSLADYDLHVLEAALDGEIEADHASITIFTA